MNREIYSSNSDSIDEFIPSPFHFMSRKAIQPEVARKIKKELIDDERDIVPPIDMWGD